MNIFVLVPVFNRLHHTQRVVEALRRQTVANQIRMVFINDGSTDGTSAYLQKQVDVVELIGDGNLWWGGAIQKGLDYVYTQAIIDDFVLFLNNDTWFAPNYVETLLRVSIEAGNAAVGSVIHEENRSPSLVSIGPRVNINRLAVWDKFNEISDAERWDPQKIYRVDALSGRGTLYPVKLFGRFGGMRPHFLPHYMADYEIAMRFARNGVSLLVSSEAVIFSPPVYGNDVLNLCLWDRLFSMRSSSNIFHRVAFYMLVGTPLQRLTAPLRLLGFGVWRKLLTFKG